MEPSQPVPSGQEQLLTCTPEWPEVGAGRSQSLGVVVSFAAPHMADENERLPIRLSAVLDKSGSMAGSKLELVKATTRFLVHQLRPNDSLGIVTYDTEVEETLPFQQATAAMKQSAQALVDKIADGSCTNLSGGLFRGVQQLHANQPAPTPEGTEKWAVDAVFLFTDGQANVGITDEAQLASMLQTVLLPSGKKVKVHTFGFGDDHNPGLLQKISDVSAGDYYYIRSEEEIPTAFAEALGGLLSVSAQNVVLTIKAASAGVEIERVQTPFPTVRQSGGEYKVTVGDLYTEEQKDILVTLTLPPLPTPAPADPPPTLTLAAEYLDVATGTFATRTATLALPRPATDVAPIAPPHPDVTHHRQRFQTSAAMQRAIQLAEAGNLAAAQQVLAVTEQELSSGPALPSTHAMVTDLQNLASGYRNRSEYDTKGAKSTRSIMQAYSKQRRCNSHSVAAPARPSAAVERLAANSAAFVSNIVQARATTSSAMPARYSPPAAPRAMTTQPQPPSSAAWMYVPQPQAPQPFQVLSPQQLAPHQQQQHQQPPPPWAQQPLQFVLTQQQLQQPQQAQQQPGQPPQPWVQAQWQQWQQPAASSPPLPNLLPVTSMPAPASHPLPLLVNVAPTLSGGPLPPNVAPIFRPPPLAHMPTTPSSSSVSLLSPTAVSASPSAGALSPFVSLNDTPSPAPAPAPTPTLGPTPSPTKPSS